MRNTKLFISLFALLALMVGYQNFTYEINGEEGKSARTKLREKLFGDVRLRVPQPNGNSKPSGRLSERDLALLGEMQFQRRFLGPQAGSDSSSVGQNLLEANRHHFIGDFDKQVTSSLNEGINRFFGLDQESSESAAAEKQQLDGSEKPQASDGSVSRRLASIEIASPTRVQLKNGQDRIVFDGASGSGEISYTRELGRGQQLGISQKSQQTNLNLQIQY